MYWLGDAALRTLLVAILARLALVVLRVTNAQQEKAVWTTVLAGALAMPLLLRYSVLPVLPVPRALATTVVSPGVGYTDSLSHYVDAALFMYVSVSLLLALRMLIAVARMWRSRACAQPLLEPWTRGCDVRASRELRSPATFGATILLPLSYASWSNAKRSMVLQHEQAHVRHHDSYIQWLAGAHICLFWFSPLSWWLRRRLAELAEYTSDDQVLRSATPKVDYAAVLLDEARAGRTDPTLVSMAGHPLERRIERILSATQPPPPPSRPRRALAVGSIALFIALAAGSGQPLTAGPQPRYPALANIAHNPGIVSGPPAQELRDYYPPEAATRGIDGLVGIAVTVDPNGSALATQVLREAPAGMGFGQAAIEVARRFKYENSTGHTRSITYRIKFALAAEPAKQARPSRR